MATERKHFVSLGFFCGFCLLFLKLHETEQTPSTPARYTKVSREEMTFLVSR